MITEMAEIVIDNTKVVLVNVYAPHDPNQVLFLRGPSNNLLSKYGNENLVLGGDLNCVIGILDKCHLNAVCNNTNGGYNCSCKNGYSGDGHNCTGMCLKFSVCVSTKSSSFFACYSGKIFVCKMRPKQLNFQQSMQPKTNAIV